MDERYEVIVTPKAEENLESLIDYLIVNESCETANKVRLTLLEEIESLTKKCLLLMESFQKLVMINSPSVEDSNGIIELFLLLKKMKNWFLL